MLWMLLLITFTLAMIQEMSARMGVVTGKGLADLIRERFGIRLTMVVMVLLVFTNLTNTMGEFAGVAGASSILGLNRFIAIPAGRLLRLASGRQGLIPRRRESSARVLYPVSDLRHQRVHGASRLGGRCQVGCCAEFSDEP